MDNDEEIVIEARGLRKFFGGVQALRDASFTLRKAEVLAIVGANGAGKSTLLKILSGVFPPDEGTLRIGGEEIRSFNVVASRDHGIETVYQDLALVPNMDAAYNLFLGRPIRKWGVFADRKRMYEKTRSVLNDLGVTTLQDIGQPIEGLSGGQRQALAIGRAVTWGKGVVILDEPVAALGILRRFDTVGLAQSRARVPRRRSRARHVPWTLGRRGLLRRVRRESAVEPDTDRRFLPGRGQHARRAKRLTCPVVKPR